MKYHFDTKQRCGQAGIFTYSNNGWGQSMSIGAGLVFAQRLEMRSAAQVCNECGDYKSYHLKNFVFTASRQTGMTKAGDFYEMVRGVFEKGTFIPGTAMSLVETKAGRVMSMGGKHTYQSSTYSAQRELARGANGGGKLLKGAGRALGVTSTFIAWKDYKSDPKTAGLIKAVTNTGLLFIRINPFVGIGLAVLDFTGASDWIYYQATDYWDKNLGGTRP